MRNVYFYGDSFRNLLFGHVLKATVKCEFCVQLETIPTALKRRLVKRPQRCLVCGWPPKLFMLFWFYGLTCYAGVG